jgi:hypothetical protein
MSLTWTVVGSLRLCNVAALPAFRSRGTGTELMAWWTVLQLTGLALCVVGAAIIFLFGYPPKEEERRALFTRFSRLALLLVFCGFLLQLAAAVAGALK